MRIIVPPNSLQARFRQQHSQWLVENPEGTLGELQEWLDEAYQQCLEFVESDDPPIEHTDDIPSPLFEYLDAWEDHDGEPFSFREPNLDEDLSDVEYLIEEHGEDTKLASFPEDCQSLRSFIDECLAEGANPSS